MNLTLVKKELPLEYQYNWKNHLVCQALVSLGSPALTEGSGLLLRTYLRISFYYLPVLKRKKEMKERKKKKETFKSILKFTTSVYLLFPQHLILLFGKIEVYGTLIPKL